jgi:NDP-4-keto-2,6-dideoxyhexose 3-C-methyltransferase
MAEATTTQKEPLLTGVKTRATCRACESRQLVDVLDFGNPFVSNFADVADATNWPRVPLELVLCTGCTLLQLRHTTPSDWLYRHYWYKSGVNAAMRAALADIARKASEFVSLRGGDKVLDIGCNDGTLLRSYETQGIHRVGFEPAENLAREASTDGSCRIINEFFSAAPVTGQQFRIITSIAMFYDLEDPNKFVADAASLLAKDGVWVIEMHYLLLTLARNAFDAVCHEHLEYYSLRSLEPLLARHGLEIADVETNEVNGGSFRVYIVHRGSESARVFERWGRVESARASERRLALDQPATYQEFGDRVHKIGDRLRAFLQKEHSRGKELFVYGASTKGNTLLQIFGFDHRLLRAAAERNPEKWGKFTVGTWIPIVSEAEARAHADYFLLLPWHFLADMRNREREFLDGGGKLIAPLPEPRVIDSTGTHRIG